MCVCVRARGARPGRAEPCPTYGWHPRNGPWIVVQVVPPLCVPRAAVQRGIFRSGVSLSRFCRLFYRDNAQIVYNKNRRWQVMLRATRNGTLLDRPATPPLWHPHKEYHPPMFGKLQSSYADVEAEMNTMRSKFGGDWIMFIAGDGLALMRMNHVLAAKSDQYFDMNPAVIPVQGARAGRLRARARAQVVLTAWLCGRR